MIDFSHFFLTYEISRVVDNLILTSIILLAKNFLF
jgi:hypothetical protein